MLVSITKVTPEKHAKGYMFANVEYLKDGNPEKRQIMGFAAPNVYATLVGLTSFPVDANIVLEKSGKFWNWKNVELQSSGENVSEQPAKSVVQTGRTNSATGKVLGSNYETPEERARRQVYIVRQSSVSSAIEFAKATEPKGVQMGVDDVIGIAKQFEAYVFDTPNLSETPE